MCATVNVKTVGFYARIRGRRDRIARVVRLGVFQQLCRFVVTRWTKIKELCSVSSGGRSGSGIEKTGGVRRDRSRPYRFGA